MGSDAMSQRRAVGFDAMQQDAAAFVRSVMRRDRFDLSVRFLKLKPTEQRMEGKALESS